MIWRLSLLAALLGSVAATAAPQTAEQQAPGFLQKIERISPHVHLLRQAETYFFDGVGNIVVVEQRDGLVLVDSGGLFGSGQRAIGLIKAISPKPVKAVVITHWHSDHNLGLSAMIRAWPKMQIIAHEATIQAMLEGRPPGVPRASSKDFETKRAASYANSFARAREQELAAPSSPPEHAALERELATLEIRIADLAGTYTVIPNRSFKHRLHISDPVASVDVLFLGRANTAGDTLLWVPSERVLATGDVVDQPIPFMFDVYPSEMLRVFDRIRALKPRVLIPGHGQALPLSYLDRVARLVLQVQQQVTPLARRNLSLEEVRKEAHFPHPDEFAGADPWLQSYFRQYALDPLIDSVYREAKGDRLGPLPVLQP